MEILLFISIMISRLTRRSNEYTGADYKEAIRVLKRVCARREQGIVITRGAAGRELVPAYSRPAVPS
jgi:hypothetical protein